MKGFLEFVASAVGIVAIIFLLAIVCSVPVMLLWNWLMPDLFGLKTIDLWQAIGLSLLCDLLLVKASSKSDKK